MAGSRNVSGLAHKILIAKIAEGLRIEVALSHPISDVTKVVRFWAHFVQEPAVTHALHRQAVECNLQSHTETTVSSTLSTHRVDLFQMDKATSKAQKQTARAFACGKMSRGT